FDVTTTDFDAVVYVYDSNMNLVGCEDSNTGIGSESIWISQTTQGEDYYVRIHSADGSPGAFELRAYFLPPSEIRAGWFPNPSSDALPVGYRVTELTKRQNYAANNVYIQANRLEFTNLGTGDVYEVEIPGNNGNFTLTAIPDACYGNQYDVRVQVMCEGKWCGYGIVRPLNMEAEPSTRLLPGYGGQTYGLSSNLKVVFSGPDQLVEWRFITDNGNDVVLHTSTNSTISMDEIGCLRYGRIYSIEVRVTYCGITGPWSVPDFIFTGNIPYTRLRDQYCGTVQYAGATVLCDFVSVADQYAWQFAPVDPDDPLLTPLGPAIVSYSETTSMYLLPLGLEFGTTYRVGIKPFLGFTGGCNSVQEGDYGQFCLITIGIPGQVAPNVQARDLTIEENLDEWTDVEVFPNPASSGQDVQMILSSGGLADGARLMVFNSAGQMVENEILSRMIEGDVIKFNSLGWTSGMYHLQIIDNRTTIHKQFVIR
ncbi:MAG: T9SS type A sorting domain-containing protein, partial [Bacteroidota bacterium]